MLSPYKDLTSLLKRRTCCVEGCHRVETSFQFLFPRAKCKHLLEEAASLIAWQKMRFGACSLPTIHAWREGLLRV